MQSCYEQGQWTPVLTSEPSGLDYAVKAGTYTKVGRPVQVTIRISTKGI
jgi:hypothetical protein